MEMFICTDHPPPKRTISADGELREEYEAEMRKVVIRVKFLIAVSRVYQLGRS